MSTQLVKASTQLSTALGIEVQPMLDTIKRQCFRGVQPENVSNEQLAAFVAVANELKVNPLLPGMLYAYPDRGAIFPIIGPDGVYKRLSEHPDVDSWETTVFPEDPGLPPTHATTLIYRKGRETPVKYTAYLSEWKVGNNPNWNTRPRHMLGLRSLKQAARQVIHGLPGDEDDRIISGVIDVTPNAPEAAPVRPTPPKRERGVAAAKAAMGAVQTVDAEIVESSETKPEPAKEPEAPVQGPHVIAHAGTTTVVEMAAKLDEKKAEPAKPAPEKKPEAPKPSPATKLADGQRITFEAVEVVEFAKKTINGKPSIEAELRGAYTGKVYHLGGAEDAAWQLQKPVNVTLVGKKLTSGTVITLVEKLEVSSGGEAVELF